MHANTKRKATDSDSVLWTLTALPGPFPHVITRMEVRFCSRNVPRIRAASLRGSVQDLWDIPIASSFRFPIHRPINSLATLCVFPLCNILQSMYFMNQGYWNTAAYLKLRKSSMLHGHWQQLPK